MKRIVLAAATVGLMLTGTTASASAEPHHSGGPNKADPPCTISPSQAAVGEVYILSVTGLPAMSPINLFVTDPLGNVTGSPLGETPDGTFAMNEWSTLPGTTTYQFTGATKFKNTAIYATCSVDAY